MTRRLGRWSCVTRKARYRNRRAALAGIDTHRRRWALITDGAEPPDLWPYHCPHCGRWHMTSRPQVGIEANTGRATG